MKRDTAKGHGFEHGQTILYAGRNMAPIERPVRCVVTWSGRRIVFRKPDGDTHTLNNFEPFWAAPAVPDGAAVLASMVAEYVTMSRRTMIPGPDLTLARTALSGMAHMLAHVAMLVHGLGEEGAAEWVGDMINDEMNRRA